MIDLMDANTPNNLEIATLLLKAGFDAKYIVNIDILIRLLDASDKNMKCAGIAACYNMVDEFEGDAPRKKFWNRLSIEKTCL